MANPQPHRAAQYVRMSTEKQIYSTDNQMIAIGSYALAHGFEIVRTYADEGRSGLQLKGRAALQAMLRDVLSGDPGFDAILVFDVSRWGRFQDTDESAHYEFVCRSAGVQVHYCAELFENDGSLASTIIKNLKRAMAGEYSRELSAKVWTAQSRLAARGYRHFSRQYAQTYNGECAWREEYRRLSNGDQFLLIAASALHHPPSKQWRGYYQRTLRKAA